MTKTTTVNSTDVINTALDLLKNDQVRLHKSEALPTVDFRDYETTQARYGITGDNNFFNVVNAIYTQKNNFSNEFSVSFTGLLAVAIALTEKPGNVSVHDIQSNGFQSDELFGTYFDGDTTNLVEFAYHPWSHLNNNITTDERASANYQRRIRTKDGSCSDTQGAYKTLARTILLNMRNNDGSFRPAREDYRAIS